MRKHIRARDLQIQHLCKTSILLQCLHIHVSHDGDARFTDYMASVEFQIYGLHDFLDGAISNLASIVVARIF
jgi:hypothetical protein